MPEKKSKKFSYADDWVIVTRHKILEVTEEILTTELTPLGEYFRKWRLQINVSKTEASYFHLNNKMANRELQIYFEDNLIAHNKNPKYLGVTFDRTQSFKQHISKVNAKLKMRNNIMQKLCGTTWESLASTLHCSALGLVYAIAEHFARVWVNNPYVKIIDAQVNNTMRIISQTIRSTPIYWLPVLSRIAPPRLHR
ncbi:hypothetical protein PR048_030287 [Dryococelus australis]|uniref:Reverse transcriptase domain-containing protein n=1 Tax=Dryococelus australis TaxID=614101 RepID=A0ABQ9G8L4_9NEOP|nr:hypothetical protein PR048_030287 [Dryococelus australis]